MSDVGLCPKGCGYIGNHFGGCPGYDKDGNWHGAGGPSALPTCDVCARHVCRRTVRIQSETEALRERLDATENARLRALADERHEKRRADVAEDEARRWRRALERIASCDGSDPDWTEPCDPNTPAAIARLSLS